MTKPVEMSIPPEIAKAFEVTELAPSAQPQIAPTSLASKDAPNPTAKKKHERQKSKAPKKVAAKKNEGSQAAPTGASAAPSTDGVQGIAGPGDMNFDIPNRRPPKDPIWVGEKVWMDVTWLNTKAGEFEIEVLPFKTMNGRKVYDFRGTARTSELFSLVYKAEDWVESFVDYIGWFPYKFVLHGDETKHIRNNLELFDHGAKKQYVAVHDNRIQKNEVFEEKGFKDLTPLSQDSLSGIFYVRTLQFEVGKTLKFPMTTNGSQWETEVSVLGREEVSTKMGYLKAFKCKIETRFNGALTQQGDAFMWFSDDDRKFLIKFEAKVRIGWVAGVAKRIEPGAPENGETKPASSSGPSGAAPTTTPTIEVRPATGASSGEGNPNQHGRHRTWFKKLMDSVSGVKKTNE